MTRPDDAGSAPHAPTATAPTSQPPDTLVTSMTEHRRRLNQQWSALTDPANKADTRR